MEINKADKIISLPDYREQKSLNRIKENHEHINPLFSEDIALIKPEPTETENVFTQNDLTNSQAYVKARAKLTDYFKKEFIKSDEFRNTFGNLKWDDISEKVNESINLCRDKEWEKEEYNDKVYAFTGKVYGLYTEIAVDRKNGRTKSVYIEID